MPGACHNICVAVITLAMVTKKKAYTVISKLQAIEVAKKSSKEASGMSSKNAQLTVSMATNTMNTP